VWLVTQLTPNRESFISVLRIVRRWAKRRGLYSNKMGYLGGVNWCILVCFINQLYPTAAPSTLLLRFFMVLSNWKWPLAIQVRITWLRVPDRLLGVANFLDSIASSSSARIMMQSSGWRCGTPTPATTGIR